ncbi:MAG: amino acid adenylation domain-containing protein, partial [Paralcaligenes sp.]
RLDSFLAEDRARPFNIKKPPLMRIALIRLAPARHLVIWTRHHLTVDGWSLGVVLNEVFVLYKTLCAGRPHTLAPAPAFRAYVNWERSNDRSAALNHWRNVLATDMPYERDPAQHRHIVASETAAPKIQAIVRYLPQSISDRLNTLARSCRVTVNTVIQAAWSIVDSRLNGSDTALFGAVETVRPSHLAREETTDLVGIQIQIQPVLAHIDHTPLRIWLEDLQAKAVAARNAGSIGMDELRDLLGLSRDSLPFDSLVGFQNYPLDETAAFAGSGLTLVESGDITLPDMPLNLMVERQADGLCLQLMFDQNRYGVPDATLRLDMLMATLTAMPDSQDVPVEAIDALPESVMVPLFDDATKDTPLLGSDQTVVQAILDHAARRPLGAAITMGEQSLSYASLIAIASIVAARLAACGIGHGTRVGLHLERTPLAIASIVGIMLRGAAYVPIDLGAPDERKAFIMAEAGLAGILSVTSDDVAGMTAIAVGDLTPQTIDAAAPINTDAFAPPAGSDEAYVIFTSGSTGRPKGVSVGHDNLSYHVAARNAAYPGEPNRILLLTFPLYFDGSVTGIFGTLSIGGTLVLPRPIEATDPDRLAALIRDQHVTQAIMIPSQWSLQLSAGAQADLNSLEVVVVAGEACPRDLVERHYVRLPSTLLANEYGPTETTVWATLERCVAGETGPVAIGHPIPGTRAYVADRKNRRCPPGSIGELLIAGPGIARGYVGRADLTAERFIANPFDHNPGLHTAYRSGDRVVLGFDGKLRFHGRADDQVKISGYRIELAEISACLRELPGVEEAVTVIHGAGALDRTLIVAHVAGINPPSQEAILHHAQRLLPAYMVPHSVMLHDRLPRTKTGKIDRDSLPAPLPQEAARVAPEGETEEAIAQVWQAVLGCQSIGRFDDFFAIGGRSLDAMQVVSRLRRDLNLAVDLIDLFEFPRLNDLARRATSRNSDQGTAIRKRQRTRIDLATTSPEQTS